MNYKDQWVENEKGEKFIFTVEMQRQLSMAGLPVDPAQLVNLRQEQPRAQSRPSQRDDRPQKSDGYQYGADREEKPTYSEERPATREQEIEGPETIQIDPMTGKYIGRVKWFNEKKGYGFLLRGAGEEIFFHKSGSVGEMETFEDGQWILYDVEDTNKGPEATDIEPYEGEIPA